MEECLGLDQRTFGSLLRQELVDFDDNGFSVTTNGSAVYKAYLYTDTVRLQGIAFSPTVQVLLFQNESKHRRRGGMKILKAAS